MKKRPKVLSLVLSLVFLINIFGPVQVFASDDFGYIDIEYLDMDTGQHVAPFRTEPVKLNGKPSVNRIVNPVSVSGYEVRYAINDGVEKAPNNVSIHVTEGSRSKVTFYYKANTQTRTVKYYGVLIGTGEIFDTKQKSVEVSGSPAKVQTTAPTPTNPNWKFKYSTIGKNGSKSSSKNVTVEVKDNDVEVYYWFEPSYGEAEVMLTIVDNELDSSGKFVKNQENGKDFFGRKDDKFKVNGIKNITVSSPTGGKEGLDFAYAVIEHNQGNPNDAINNHIQKFNSKTFSFDITTISTNWYVHFYYIPKGSNPGDGGGTTDPNGGKIVFNPNDTDWTNLGKTGEGTGRYPIEVKYDGENPAIGKGSVTWHHFEEGKTEIILTGNPPVPTEVQGPPIEMDHSDSFDVKFPLDNITVTGDGNGSFGGDGGTVYIEKEGEGLKLEATGRWGQAEYNEPKPPDGNDTLSSMDIPNAPLDPKGQSGLYNIDWTKPEIYIDNPQSKWVKDPVPYPVKVTVDDNLSGFSNGSVDVTDSSHYSRNNSDSLPHAEKSYSKTVMLHDGMYKIAVNATDRATNDNADSKSTYYIDGTDPEVTFNIKPGIFSVENGAVRKPSKKGIDDGFYGELTASDNLSGVAKIQYGWTFENKKNDVKYEVIYTSPYTYTDRYQERIKKEIEKPVGDNLFLHIELWDTAGNYTYKVFGPYEDPIKLRDFQVTDVRDPKWQEVFWKDNKPTGVHFKANKLPLDNTSNPIYKNADMKKGYSFYFDVISEYLYREEDKIVITPTLYWVKDGKKVPVDMYYQLNNNPFIKMGSEEDTIKLHMKVKRKKTVIGELSELVLKKSVRICKGREWLGIGGWRHKYPADVQYKDGKEQYWYGKYLIPQTAVFVKKGDSPRPENILEGGEILINFQIIAYKNGIETLSKDQIYVYIPKQWKAEGGPKSNKYTEGDIILYNNKKSTLDDFRTNITH